MSGAPTFAVTVPPADLVSIADARAFASIPAAVPDVVVTSFIAAAQGFLDGPDGWLNRCLGAQTIAATLSGGWRGPGGSPIALVGPVTGLVGITGLPGTDSFGSSAARLSGDALVIRDCFGPTWSGGLSAPIVVTYTAGSPAGVIAQVRPMLCTMVAKQVTVAAASGRDPMLRSESIPDTFSKTWGSAGGAGDAGPFGAATLAPIEWLRRYAT